MYNINEILADNIQKFRKKARLTQYELAEKLDVSFQAVSKWENAKSAPDILLLPILADLFSCSIDELFSREMKTETHYVKCSEFPWNDDDVIRGVVCEGRTILTVNDGIIDKFTFEFNGDAKNVKSHCNMVVNGEVKGNCNAGVGLEVHGNVGGHCNAGDGLEVHGDVGGHCNVGCDLEVAGSIDGICNVGGAISAGGDIRGNIRSGGEVVCEGNINGDITCEKIAASGDVTANSINGEVTCKTLKCDNIDGKVNIE